ncbi:thioesterase domain-containing protein [Dankookia sp. GCM10030260]|uniref:thioesterase domain-containing protein n=1 Tax=Dankookia sp. GCM10030260 TaxID=3273390 RepID=UPI003608FF50
MPHRPPEVRHSETGADVLSRPLLILIGGAGDGTLRKVGQVVDWLRARPDAARREVHYFFHWQKGAVLGLIGTQPPGRPIRLIGHSWGGNCAARVAAALGQQGRPVDLLVTIDPVTRGIGPAFLAQVKAGARRWINVRAGGAAGFDYSDLVAAIGGPYGDAPRDHADQHLVVPHPHAAFAAMMQRPLPEGATLLDLVIA